VRRGLADTSLFIANESGRSIAWERAPEAMRISIVTVAELRAGVLAAADLETRAKRLATLDRTLRIEAVPIDEVVAAAWATLRVALRDVDRRMKANDAWIAATAIALGVPLVTQDADFDGVPRLDVVRV
jgi:predicted nucleic acid-binding protein